jgi:lysine-specific demethylase 8
LQVSARSCSVGKEAADAESERVEREHACAHFVAGAALAECSPIERVDARTLSVDGFRARYMMPSGDGTPPKPVILTHALDEWPALSAEGEASWRPQQLKARLGTRLVPVETYSTEHATSTYLSDSWEQRVMAFGEYIDRYCLCGDSGGGSSGSDDDREEDVTMARGYLAQHQLFDQIPPLREGIRTPSYCAALTPDDESAPPSCEFRTDPLVSAWFGPGGTVSPLHNDPFHNLLAQAVGYKYVRLIDAAHTPRLYPRSTLPNNSHVNLDQPDPAAHPKFAGTPFHHAVLGPTEALYIPRHCWHYVRSLETSFSVSFWWGAKIALLLRPDGELAKVY